MDDTRQEFRPGFVAVDEDRISGVGPDRGGACPLPGYENIDTENCLIMPGLINTHTHAAMTLFRGLADDLRLREWLYDYIFPAEACFINGESVYWGTKLAILEMIQNGITTFADGYFFAGQIAKVVKETGIRAVVGQGIIDFPTPDIPDVTQNLETAREFLDKYSDFAPNVYPSIFCHSPYTCNAGTLAAIKELTRSREALFQIHLSETKGEVKEIQKKSGLHPAYYLDNLGILDNLSIVAHAVWLNDAEIKLLAKRGTGISHVAASNMKLAVGVAPVAEFIKSGIRVGLGTDGCASNNRLNILRDVDLAAKTQKIKYQDPTVCPAPQLVEMITREGARALNLGHLVGSIEIGKLADIIVIPLDKPHLTPIYNPYSHIIYTMRGSDVRDVIIGGKFIMHNRILCTIDKEDTMREIHYLADKIKKRINEKWKKGGSK